MPKNYNLIILRTLLCIAPIAISCKIVAMEENKTYNNICCCFCSKDTPCQCLNPKNNNNVENVIENKNFDLLEKLIKNYVNEKKYKFDFEVLGFVSVNNYSIDDQLKAYKAYKNKKPLSDSDYIVAVITKELYENKNVALAKHLIRKKFILKQELKIEINFTLFFDGINNLTDNEFEIAKFCIENKVFDVNDKILRFKMYADWEDHKLIMHAFMYKNLKLAKYLIENGSEITDTYQASVWEIRRKLFSENKMLQVVEYLVDNGIYIFKGCLYNSYTGNYEAKMTKKQANLISQVGDLIDVLSNQKEVALKEIHPQILKEIIERFFRIEDLFSDKDIPTYAKLFCLEYLVEFHKNKKNIITLDYIKQLYAKIKFNYNFLTNPKFKNALEFAEKNNILDINNQSILQAKLICSDNKVVSNLFETSGPLQICLTEKTNPLNNEQTEAKKDYANARDNLKQEYKKQQFINLENTKIVLNNLQKILCIDVAAKIIGFSGIRDFFDEKLGNKIDGQKFSKPELIK